MDALRRLSAWLTVADAPADIVDDLVAVERRVAGEEKPMDRVEAIEELGRRYRIRILVSLEHGEQAIQLHASTLVEHQEEIGSGLVGLCELVVPRLTSALEVRDASQVEGAATTDGSGPGAGESREADEDRHE